MMKPKRTVEDAKINNAERFFQQLKIDGYEVKFCQIAEQENGKHYQRVIRRRFEPCINEQRYGICPDTCQQGSGHLINIVTDSPIPWGENTSSRINNIKNGSSL